MRRRQLLTTFLGLSGAALSLWFPAAACAEQTACAVTDLLGREVRLKKMPDRIVVANYILNFLMTGDRKSVV